jgi:NOL1/NOP2/sun family putative RNA methylase
MKKRRLFEDFYTKRLENKGFEFEKIKGLSYGFRIKKEPFRITSTEEYLLGYFYIQDKASMLSVVELKPKPNELLLDAASAPGGKTSHLAQIMKNKGVIVAVDNNKERLKAQLFNLQRLGIKNTASFKLSVSRIKNLGLGFDKILLDAPCSATGTFWKEKKRLKSVNKYEVKKHSKLQKNLLKSCYRVLKKKGLLLYSTCSIEKEENEDNVAYAEELGLRLIKTKYFFPQTDNTIGFFYALFEKL